MSLNPFAALYSRHPEWRGILGELRRQLVETLSKDNHAVIDDRILVQQLHVDATVIKKSLVELADLDGLRARVFWECPNGFGTVKEADHIKEFPYSIECERCGQTHVYTDADVEFLFVPTDHLMNELRVTTE